MLRSTRATDRSSSASSALLLILAVTAWAAPACAAAAVGAAPEEAPGGFAFRGRPLPECSSFLISEFGMHYLMNESGSLSRSRHAFGTLDLGFMKNLNRVHAAGLLLHIGADDRRTGVGAGLRYRRWLSRDQAVNLTLGLDISGVTNEDGNGDIAGLAPWAELGLSMGDYVTVSLRAEDWGAQRSDYVPSGGVTKRGSDTTWHLGGKLGGAGGLLTTAAFVLLGVATLGSF